MDKTRNEPRPSIPVEDNDLPEADPPHGPAGREHLAPDNVRTDVDLPKDNAPGAVKDEFAQQYPNAANNPDMARGETRQARVTSS